MNGSSLEEKMLGQSFSSQENRLNVHTKEKSVISIDNNVTKNSKISNSLGDGPIDDNNDRVGEPEKGFSVNFTISKTNFYLNLHYYSDESSLP